MIWSKKVESIISSGVALHDTGVSNWALSKEQALDALDKFEAEKISVLGGDVYELNEFDSIQFEANNSKNKKNPRSNHVSKYGLCFTFSDGTILLQICLIVCIKVCSS